MHHHTFISFHVTALFTGVKIGRPALREKTETNFRFLRKFQRPGAVKFAMRPRGPQAAGIRPCKPTTLRKECKFLQEFSAMPGCGGLEIGCGFFGKKLKQTFAFYASSNDLALSNSQRGHEDRKLPRSGPASLQLCVKNANFYRSFPQCQAATAWR